MEGIPHQRYEPGHYENKEREDFRERNFPRIVAQHILEHAFDDLSEAGFKEEEIEKLEQTFAQLPEEAKLAVLAVPAQLRVRLYERYAEKVHAGDLSLADFWNDLRKNNEERSYTLGYHLSPREIRPDLQGNWVIKGTEPDHRNDDVPMAYYSLDYRNRYREKPTKYLYVVRAEVRDESGHYRDNNGVWGRAPSLSVVDSFDLPQIEKEMDDLMKVSQEKRNEEKAA